MMDERMVIESRFRSDLSRVTDLITLYQWLADGGHGGPPEQRPDLLRAAVVLLHPSLEDFFRSVAAWKLPIAPAESLDRIPKASRRTIFNLHWSTWPSSAGNPSMR